MSAGFEILLFIFSTFLQGSPCVSLANKLKFGKSEKVEEAGLDGLTPKILFELSISFLPQVLSVRPVRCGIKVLSHFSLVFVSTVGFLVDASFLLLSELVL